jgi:hypothetical protein
VPRTFNKAMAEREVEMHVLPTELEFRPSRGEYVGLAETGRLPDRKVNGPTRGEEGVSSPPLVPSLASDGKKEVAVDPTAALTWRTDGKCNPNALVPESFEGATQAEDNVAQLTSLTPFLCDPGDASGPCCSVFGVCGNSAEHCLCNGCLDSRKIVAMVRNNIHSVAKENPASSPAHSTIVSDTEIVQERVQERDKQLCGIPFSRQALHQPVEFLEL